MERMIKEAKVKTVEMAHITYEPFLDGDILDYIRFSF